MKKRSRYECPMGMKEISLHTIAIVSGSTGERRRDPLAPDPGVGVCQESFWLDPDDLSASLQIGKLAISPVLTGYPHMESATPNLFQKAARRTPVNPLILQHRLCGVMRFPEWLVFGEWRERIMPTTHFLGCEVLNFDQAINRRPSSESNWSSCRTNPVLIPTRRARK